jgi:hypothetical protein
LAEFITIYSSSLLKCSLERRRSVFVHAVPDNRGKKDGYYCSLVESRRVDGVPTHVNRVSLGFVPSERLPYLRAAFNRGDPEEILEREKRRLEERRLGSAPGDHGGCEDRDGGQGDHA